ncbi:MAG: NAD-dependent epimerase/dehydratase family protein [Kiloniellales bacterium]
MKHVIFGGDGFVGRYIAVDLLRLGQEVIVADVARSELEIYPRASFVGLDITDRAALAALPLAPDDVVYNMAARMLSPIMPRSARYDFFWPVNYRGAEHILAHMEANGCRRLVQFTTDMIYGHATRVPQPEDSPTVPLGEYGHSKLATEELCRRYRDHGMMISIFRPRLIIGPGRLGILAKLFKLVENNLPVPMIGSGRNQYQFISVYDCASAAVSAWKAGFPNAEYNIGSDDPPSVRELLTRLIREAGSRSFLVPTPAALVKALLTALDRINLPLMDPEQYLIADEACILDTSKAKNELGWQPRYKDDDMLLAAYREYRSGREIGAGGAVRPPPIATDLPHKPG